MKRKSVRRLLLSVAAAVLLCCAAVGIYAADYYHIDETAAVMLEGTDNVTVSVHDGMAVFAPPQAQPGLIFYPGGKVEFTAYAPLMELLAENGVLCVIPKMPLNLAVMDVNASERVAAQFPEIDTWYIGGHSLGGSMAATHAASCTVVKGLVLLAAYSTADLTDTDLQVLSIYGSEDKVLNMDKYTEYFPNLPADTTELILHGGNHAQFGSYGTQKGDGKALIPPMEQQLMTLSAILSFMGLTEEEVPDEAFERYTLWLETDTDGVLRSVLTLIPAEQRFVLSEPIYSSRMNTGSYTVDGDTLTCCSEAGEAVYHFRITDSGMVYIAADSLPINAHGSVFGTNPNACVEVPDGGLYTKP